MARDLRHARAAGAPVTEDGAPARGAWQGSAPSTASPAKSDGFRPDLEGLRAVAVIAVLLYHARVPGITGGYVGVDIFFVLSGFLITGMLLRELTSTGRISLPAFYARRARRLLPAAALTLLVTAIASAIVLPPLRLGDVSTDIAAAAAYISNIRFAVQATDYLASTLPPSPVLHFWSLGVEEQFYVFWPAIVGLVAGGAFAIGHVVAGTRRLTVALALTFVLSLVLGIWLTTIQQPWAFFSLPTRAWELALGGLMAMPVAAGVARHALRPVVGWLGIAAIALSVVLFDDRTPFPGIAALLPTVGSALVIASSPAPGAIAAIRPAIPGPDGPLSLAPMRFLGRISYSLYLWHWPILVLPAVVLGPLHGAVRLGLAGLSIVVAAASQRWVEEPIRHGRIVGLRPARVLAFAGATTLVVTSVGLALAAASAGPLRPTGPTVGGTIDHVDLPAASSPPPGVSSRPTPRPTLLATAVPADLAPTLAAARDDLPVIYSDGCHLDPNATVPAPCVFGVPTSATTVVLFGDSHAAQWFPALERLSLDHGWRLITLTKSACASVDVPVWSTIFDRSYDECTTWRAAAMARIASEHPALVVLSNSRAYELAIGGKEVSASDHEDVWAAGVTRTLDQLRTEAGHVVLIGDTVRMSDDPPVCLSAHLDDATACATPFSKAVDSKLLVGDSATVTATGAGFIDPTSWMCQTDPCPAVIGRLLVYRDQHHMTATFSRALAARLFAVLPSLGP